MVNRRGDVCYIQRVRRFAFALTLCGAAFAQSASPPKWFDIPQADLMSRYRYIDNSGGAVTADDLQYRFTGRVKIGVPQWGTFLGARIETGSLYSSSWSNTGIGRGDSEGTLNVKTFFLAQRLGHHGEFDIGAMDMDNGAGTEATYSDADGYVEGYRLRFTGLKGRYAPSRVSATWGFVGDFTTLNVFARLHRLTDSNYLQLLAERSFNGATNTSFEFDRLAGINLLRAAVKTALPKSWLVNDLQLETTARLNNGETAGWAVHLTRTKNRLGRFNPGIFYSHLPLGVFRKGTTQALLNGDIYSTGKRVGFTTKYAVTKEFELSTLITRRLDTDPGPRWRAQIAARYQLAPLLHQAWDRLAK
jgi:hypothetical protein